jgi:S1-C subfamily serine protease
MWEFLMLRNKLVSCVILLTIYSGAAHGQGDLMTPKEIFAKYKAAIVQVIAVGRGIGSGFLISEDGLLLTANHVVASKDQTGAWHYHDLQVLLPNSSSPGSATAVSAITPDSVNFDFAILRIKGSHLPFLPLGTWDDVREGDVLTILPSIGPVPLLLLGTVSAHLAISTEFGAKPVNALLFQSPVRQGFSGGAAISPAGRVVGIVTNRLVGLSPSLDQIRQKLIESKSNPNVQVIIKMHGVEQGDSLLELINVLDSTLISGLGAAVAIDYAKQMVPTSK